MNFKSSSSGVLKQKPPKKIKVNGKGGRKEFFSRLSGGFMLPISVMSIAGLLLGIGAAIVSNSSGHPNIIKLGTFIKNIGDPIFAAMPILFAAAIVIAFTDDAGAAVFSVIVAMLIFSSIQSVFIDPTIHGEPLSQYAKEHPNLPKDTQYVPDGYKILFTQWGRNPSSLFSLVGKTMGITSLNSSIFGGIIVGWIVSVLYKKYNTIKLPMAIAFFGGKRFIPIISIAAMIPLAFIFLLFWPWIGIGLFKFGNSLGHVPYGIESFIFGYCERALVPFGLHHVFYAPLWWTDAGGNVETAYNTWIHNGNMFVDPNQAKIFVNAFQGDGKSGDSFIWLAANGLPFNTITFKLANGATHTLPVFDFISQQLGIKVGRFLDGKYAFMIFGLPCAAAAIVMAAPKGNREFALSTVFGAALTSFVTGVTEPIEFTFLFLAPLLFWGFHAIAAGFSFMLMNLLGAHIGMTFSGGILDLIIYGIIPLQKGTHFWWVFTYGPLYGVMYYFVFYTWIVKANLQTPGRGTATRLFTKADYKARQAMKTVKGMMSQQAKNIVLAYGGWDNITTMSNCATRLRYDVKDISKVNEAKLKEAGAFGTVKVGTNHLQAIMGPQAAQINAEIRKHKGEALDSSKSTTNKVASAKKSAKVKKSTTKKTVSKAKSATKKKTVNKVKTSSKKKPSTKKRATKK